MHKTISQKTFDEVVQENVNDFAMTPEEAKQETIKQFQAQGINLTNVIRDLAVNPDTGKPVLNETVDKLKTHIGEKSEDVDRLIHCLEVLDIECSKSIAHRVLAGKNGAQDAIITVLEQEFSNESLTPPQRHLEVVERCLRAINSVIHKQPDIFDAESLAIIIKLLKTMVTDQPKRTSPVDDFEREEQDMKDKVIGQTMQWLQKACIMHEVNRQNIISSGIIQLLNPLISVEHSNVISEVLLLIRCLVLDDDIRVEFGCAHEHARQIGGLYIEKLTQLLGEYKDLFTLSEIILTMSTLAVRQEFCTVINEAGGLKLVLDIMSSNLSANRVNRESLKLLRALAGNDTVKAHIVKTGFAPIIKDILEIHMKTENISAAALACISTLTLRVKENSAAFFETGIAEVIVETMRIHSKNTTIQRNGAWAIRNMVSRSREQCESWISYGVEDILNNAMLEHPSVQQDIKAALRDLGCKVDLKEEWTGIAEKKIMK